MTKRDLAIKVLNLRHALKVANKCLIDDGKFGILACEDDGPLFCESRKFWADVRRLEAGE